MKNEIALKVYEVDYSFIVNNYLDKELWGKSWTLFIYKDYVFTLNLSMIDVKSETIVFEIKCNQLHWDWEADVFNSSREVRHNVKNSSIAVLKKQINGAIFDVIDWVERIDICHSDEYEQISNYQEEEKEKLEEIANDFLDENRITNEDVRDAYVKKYVSDNSTVGKRKSEYKRLQKYNVLTDLYLVFVKAINDKTREEMILTNLDNTKTEEVLKEVNNYMEQLQTEEYQEELKEALEVI